MVQTHSDITVRDPPYASSEGRIAPSQKNAYCSPPTVSGGISTSSFRVIVPRLPSTSVSVKSEVQSTPSSTVEPPIGFPTYTLRPDPNFSALPTAPPTAPAAVFTNKLETDDVNATKRKRDPDDDGDGSEDNLNPPKKDGRRMNPATMEHRRVYAMNMRRARRDGMELLRNAVPHEKRDEIEHKLLVYAAGYIADLKRKVEEVGEERDQLQTAVDDLVEEVMMLERFRKAKVDKETEGKY